MMCCYKNTEVRKRLLKRMGKKGWCWAWKELRTRGPSYECPKHYLVTAYTGSPVFPYFSALLFWCKRYSHRTPYGHHVYLDPHLGKFGVWPGNVYVRVRVDRKDLVAAGYGVIGSTVSHLKRLYLRRKVSKRSFVRQVREQAVFRQYYLPPSSYERALQKGIAYANKRK